MVSRTHGKGHDDLAQRLGGFIGQGRMMEMMVVILAGGEGSRLGGDKPLRLLGGRNLISRALDRARYWSGDVRVALRDHEQVPEPGAPVLLDDPDVWGPLAGLGSALNVARETGRSHVLTIPCDMPFLPGDLATRLAEAIGGHGVAMAASNGQLHPVCALWSVHVLDALAAYREAGRRSLRGLAETVGMAIVGWPEDAFANVNTPEELADAERRLTSKIEHVDRSSSADG